MLMTFKNQICAVIWKLLNEPICAIDSKTGVLILKLLQDMSHNQMP